MNHDYKKPWLDRWLDKRCRTKDSRYNACFMSALLVMGLIAMIPACIYMLSIGRDIMQGAYRGPNDDTIGVYLLTVFLLMPTTLHASICAALASRLRIGVAIAASIGISTFIWAASWLFLSLLFGFYMSIFAVFVFGARHETRTAYSSR